MPRTGELWHIFHKGILYSSVNEWTAVVYMEKDRRLTSIILNKEARQKNTCHLIPFIWSFKIGKTNQRCWKSVLGGWGGVVTPREQQRGFWDAENVVSWCWLCGCVWFVKIHQAIYLTIFALSLCKLYCHETLGEKKATKCNGNGIMGEPGWLAGIPASFTSQTWWHPFSSVSDGGGWWGGVAGSMEAAWMASNYTFPFRKKIFLFQKRAFKW